MATAVTAFGIGCSESFEEGLGYEHLEDDGSAPAVHVVTRMIRTWLWGIVWCINPISPAP